MGDEEEGRIVFDHFDNDRIWGPERGVNSMDLFDGAFGQDKEALAIGERRLDNGGAFNALKNWFEQPGLGGDDYIGFRGTGVLY